eukprot:1196148-Prorocentrum_minimum.AAC.3
MIEPASLLPLARFKARHLVAVGDPLQLPPLLSGDGSSQAVRSQSLHRPLFSRLSDAGVEPVLLRTQYRCAETLKPETLKP